MLKKLHSDIAFANSSRINEYLHPRLDDVAAAIRDWCTVDPLKRGTTDGCGREADGHVQGAE